MELERAHSAEGKSRLNALVAMFESKSNNEAKSQTTSIAPSSYQLGKIRSKKLKSLSTVPVKISVIEDRQEEYKNPSKSSGSSSVNKMITSIESQLRAKDSQPVTPNKASNHSSSAKWQISSSETSMEVFPEVERLVQEVFDSICRRIIIEEQDEESITESCQPASDDLEQFSEGLSVISGPTLSLLSSSSASSIAADDDENESSSLIHSIPWTPATPEKIGALWTQRSLEAAKFRRMEHQRMSFSSVHEICGKKINHLLEQYEIGPNADESSIDSPRFGSLSVKDKVAKILSNFQAVNEEDSNIQSQDVSVRTCKAFIEMTVLKTQSFHSTVTMNNQTPLVPSIQEEEKGSTQVFSANLL